MPYSNALGQRISSFRKTMKMTQSDLAEKIGVSRAAISQFEQGDNMPSVATQQKISEVFGFDIVNSEPNSHYAYQSYVQLDYYSIEEYSALWIGEYIGFKNPSHLGRLTMSALRLPDTVYDDAAIIEVRGNSMAPRYPHGARYVIYTIQDLAVQIKYSTGVHVIMLGQKDPLVRRIIANRSDSLTLRADATGEEITFSHEEIQKLIVANSFKMYKVGQAVHLPAED